MNGTNFLIYIESYTKKKYNLPKVEKEIFMYALTEKLDGTYVQGSECRLVKQILKCNL